MTSAPVNIRLPLEAYNTATGETVTITSLQKVTQNAYCTRQVQHPDGEPVYFSVETGEAPPTAWIFRNVARQNRAWRASERIVQAGYTPATPRQRATFTAGYSDGYHRYPMWASSDRDYFPDHYRAGYRAGVEDGEP